MPWGFGLLTDITQFIVFDDLLQTPVPIVFLGKKLIRLCSAKIARQRVVVTLADEFFSQGFILRYKEVTVVPQQLLGVQSLCLTTLFAAARQ